MIPRSHQSIQSIGSAPPFCSRVLDHGNENSRTAGGAQALAHRIVRTWAAEGHRVTAWVIKLHVLRPGYPGLVVAWSVRTDLVNGMPSGLGRDQWEAKYGRGEI